MTDEKQTPVVPEVEGKPWYLSRRVLSAAVMVVALILGMFNVSVDEHTQQLLVNEVEGIIVAGMAVVSGILAIWSKIKPDK